MPREECSIGDSPPYALERKPNYLRYILEADDKSLTDEAAMQKHSEEEHYKQINQSLRTDSEEDLKTRSGTIGAMRRAIRLHCEKGTVYRCVTLSADQASVYEAGFKFLWPAFTSTSRDLKQADKFGSFTKGNVSVRFTIDLDGEGVTYARDITKFSKFPAEKEVVIYPYSGFEVTAVAKCEGGATMDISLRTYDTLLIEKAQGKGQKDEKASQSNEKASQSDEKAQGQSGEKAQKKGQSDDCCCSIM